MNVCRLLADQVAQRPDAAALVEGLGRTLTFRQLDVAASNVARQLHEGGLAAGDRALVLVPMSTDLYITVVALLRLGVTVTVPDPGAGIRDIERGCESARPDAFIGVAKAHVLRLLSRRVRRVPRVFAVGRRVPGAVKLDPERAGAAVEPFPCPSHHPALITFTSGSTGVAKTAVRSHGFLLAQQRVLAEAMHLNPGELDLVTLPIVVLANLAAGVTSLIPDANLARPGDIDPAPVLEQVRRLRPTRVSASPAFLERLVECAELRQARLDSLRRIHTGGAPIFPSLLDRIGAVAPDATVVAVYGSTEAEPIAHIEASAIRPGDREAMIAGRGLLAGHPSAAIDVAILPDRWGTPLGSLTPDAFAASCLPPGRHGEIVVHGSHVLTHYLDGIGEDETKFRVGHQVWHRTGDAGWIDAENRLWLLGRCAARVSDDQGCFYPFSVECAAVELLGVRRAAALGWKGRRTLLLEPRRESAVPPVDALAPALGWARVDLIRFVPKIPVDRRHNAKVDYPALGRLLDRGALSREASRWQL